MKAPGVKTWLLVSLALNMGMGGALLARGMHCPHPPGPSGHEGGPREGRFSLEEALAKLPPATSVPLLEKWKAVRSPAEEEARRKERDELAALLEAPVFDAEAYKRRSDQMADERAERMRRIRDVVAEMAQSLDQPQRKILADSLRAKPRPPGAHGGEAPPPGEIPPPPPPPGETPPPPR